MKMQIAAAMIAASAASCATVQPSNPNAAAVNQLDSTVTVHRDGDDLLTAGLGIAGLSNPVAPAFADPAKPTAAELRRRAIWSSWRGIADLAPGSGYGVTYGTTVVVPGREYSAMAQIPGATTGHRVLAQIPDAFDQQKRCLLVAPSSGSRGVYGAISVAAPWGLPKGCAVVYTDKGTGSDYFDVASSFGADISGQMVHDAGRVWIPKIGEGVKPHEIAFKHAHSQDNPEADWGRHVVQAAQFGLQSLSQAFPGSQPYTWDNTRVIAVGISNGGGAVLRAAEEQGVHFSGIVAGEPNIHVNGHGGKALYDFALEAATLMPCAQLALPDGALPEPPLHAAAKPLMGLWCQRLKMANVLTGADVPAMAKEAYDRMRAAGWNDGSLAAGFSSTGFDLWRSVLAGYVSAYAKTPVGNNPCGFRYEVQGADKKSRAATDVERAAWWSDASGIPPGAGVALVHDNPDIYAQLQCLAEKRKDPGIAAAIDATAAVAPASKDLPVLIIHGRNDGLVPIHYSSIPYMAMLAEQGHTRAALWNVNNAQHFDAFLGFPSYGSKWTPLLPYVYRGLDQMWSVITEGKPMPVSQMIEPNGKRPFAY